MTPEEEQKGREFFATLSLKELRRRQDLASAQIRMASEQRERRPLAMERAMCELQATQRLLTEAVFTKAFGGVVR